MQQSPKEEIQLLYVMALRLIAFHINSLVLLRYRKLSAVIGHHTSEYRRGYTDGLAARSGSGNTRNTSPELPTNRGPSTAIGSSGSVDSSGICNTVQILLIQSCDQLINSDHSLTANGQHAMGCIRNGLFLAAGGQVISIPVYYSCYLTLQYQCQQ